MVIRLRIAKTRSICEANALYLAETVAAYIKATEQNVYDAPDVDLPHAELYVIFTGERKDKPSVLRLHDKGTLNIDAHVIFADEDKTGEKLDILQQYIAFSQELTRQIKQKGRTVEALTAAIEVCKHKEYTARVPRGAREGGSENHDDAV